MSDKQTQLNDDSDTLVSIHKMQLKLRSGWVLWLLYRGVALPILLGLLLSTQPDIFGGVAWQLLWLIPALIITPWMIKGNSPYALLIISMLSMVYLGASGVTLFSRFYDSGYSVVWIYIIDLILILLVNIWLFKLLKRLPSMNG